MRKEFIIGVLSFVTATAPVLAFIDIFNEISPSKEANGPHSRVHLEKIENDRVRLKLEHPNPADTSITAWLVVCEKERGNGHRNFRYEVHWLTLKPMKKDIAKVTPIEFGKTGVAHVELTEDQAARSYVVIGGHYDDGAFSTVNLPAFLRELNKDDK